MSQRVFKSNNFEIMTGWDRPTQSYFLVIEKNGAEECFRNTKDFFSNLFHTNQKMELQEVMRTLDEYKVKPPSELENDLREDCSKNIGNYFFNYSEGQI